MANEFCLRGGSRSCTTSEADGVELQKATDSAAIYNLREAHRVAIRERDQARECAERWEEEARRYAENADYWRLRAKRAERERDEARLRIGHG